MDPFLLTVWVVRLLFLALLYLFLFRIARALVGDLRAAAREPGAELGRLVVVASPAGEPEEGTSLALDAIATCVADCHEDDRLDDVRVNECARRRVHAPLHTEW